MMVRTTRSVGGGGTGTPMTTKAPCKEPDCDRPARTRGWCEMHYRRWLRTGTTDAPKRLEQCGVETCGRDATARDLCRAHYQRVLKHGSPLAETPLRGSRERCEVEGCDRPFKAKGLCRAHYERQRLIGSIHEDVPIGELDPPASALERESKGWITGGYRFVKVPAGDQHLTNGKAYKAEH